LGAWQGSAVRWRSACPDMPPSAGGRPEPCGRSSRTLKVQECVSGADRHQVVHGPAQDPVGL